METKRTKKSNVVVMTELALLTAIVILAVVFGVFFLEFAAAPNMVIKRDRRDVYSDVAALPPRRRAVRNGTRIISGRAISTGSRPNGRLLFIFWVPLEKQRMFSPVLGILEAERGRSL